MEVVVAADSDGRGLTILRLVNALRNFVVQNWTYFNSCNSTANNIPLQTKQSTASVNKESLSTANISEIQTKMPTAVTEEIIAKKVSRLHNRL